MHSFMRRKWRDDVTIQSPLYLHFAVEPELTEFRGSSSGHRSLAVIVVRQLAAPQERLSRSTTRQRPPRIPITLLAKFAVKTLYRWLGSRLRNRAICRVLSPRDLQRVVLVFNALFPLEALLALLVSPVSTGCLHNSAVDC